MKLIRELLSDQGDISMMRFMSVICVMAAVGTAICGIYKGSDLSSVAILVSAFLVPSFTGKVSQSFAEKEPK